LTGEDYAQLEKDALNLLTDYGFVNFPIDVFELAKKAFNAKLVKYSSLNKKELIKIKGYDATKDGFTVVEHMSNNSKRYIIYYDDYCNIYRQRYTIGHEIKHIYYDEEDTLKKEEDGAEYFSKVLIAPKCLIIINKMNEVEKIVEKFGLSYEASTNYLKGINNRRAAYGNFLFEFEREFLNDLKEIIKND